MAKCPVFYQAATEGVPVGGIIMWSGAADAIPTGWALCDGTSGTPDLRGRFVLGGGGSYAVGAVGGEETHKLTVAEMPRHGHTVTLQYKRADLTGSTGEPFYNGTMYAKDFDSSEVGGSKSHNNMPPYYALCYIMKL